MSVAISATKFIVNDRDDLITEASDLGWAPGYWPESIVVENETYQRVSGTDASTTYKRADGRRAVVLND